MCRLYGFRANEPTKVECTLVHAQNSLMLQSRGDLRGTSHTDGWGIAFYDNHRPQVERRATAAFEDLHFSATAERIYTGTVVAHVRMATIGAPGIVNSHPFTYGPWAFAHNGTVTGFDQLRARLIAETDPRLHAAQQGTTDSEHAFFWLLSRLAAAGIAPEAPARELPHLLHVVAESVHELAQRSTHVAPEKPPRLNFLLTDGEHLVASRWDNSLYFVVRDGIHDCEICGIPHVHHDTGFAYRAVVVASEPISNEEWHEVPNHSILGVGPEIDLCRHGIEALLDLSVPPGALA
jgi:glutamine amidotransferase